MILIPPIRVSRCHGNQQFHSFLSVSIGQGSQGVQIDKADALGRGHDRLALFITQNEIFILEVDEILMLERKVEALNNKMLALVNESVSSGDGIEAHESEFMTLSQETELLKQRIAAIQESTAKDNGEQSRLEQIQAIISERENKCMEYDDSIVRQMVECIKAYPGGKLEIIFGGGYLVEESV